MEKSIGNLIFFKKEKNEKSTHKKKVSKISTEKPGLRQNSKRGRKVRAENQ